MRGDPVLFGRRVSDVVSLTHYNIEGILVSLNYTNSLPWLGGTAS